MLKLIWFFTEGYVSRNCEIESHPVFLFVGHPSLLFSLSSILFHPALVLFRALLVPADSSLATMVTKYPSPRPGRMGWLGPMAWATGPEQLMNLVGLIAAIMAGATQPLMNIPFGQITDRFVTVDVNDLNRLRDRTDQQVVYFLYLGLATFFGTYIYVALWVRSCISTGRSMLSLAASELVYTNLPPLILMA
ncbi:hypothetical protein K437DRAFT_101591 [Tilletiaria anomala UBC 951]|uniref:ABC transmembrane type-1 domain-containing protein n=1 Tax=Tilletiaria anomala (strain ATCC 24038 / CBS 436.72 / UBC 951) TaxID=1037660 RepID=A0A066W8R1_TILAU|nr:uncharacterized protein K437DRAFT_101591 [Tilletiaria anomala UBC 951]KDN47175.1 hypothetical protein K437DRAFT_101591 [Tilletiaria anomala UBC 951]